MPNAYGGSSPTENGYDDKAKAFVLQQRDAHIVGITQPVSFCKDGRWRILFLVRSVSCIISSIFNVTMVEPWLPDFYPAH